jgi:hypothetical protein
MPDWLPITYKGFHDIPRTFLCRKDGKLLLFDCLFDEARDDYPEHYQVYLLPEIPADELEGSWEGLPGKALRAYGTMPVRLARFDKSLRKEVDFTPIEAWGKTLGWW